MRKSLPISVVTLLMGLALVMAPLSVAQARGKKPIILSFNHLFPEVAWMHTNVIVPWKKMVEQKTNGRVKVNIYPGSALARPGTMYDAVKAGSIDICLDPGPYYIGRFPMSEATQLPFLGAHSSWAASRAWMDLYKEFPALQREYADTHLLWLFSQGPGQIFSRKPVRSMNDMKGLIVRAPGGIGEIVKALGGSPVSTPAPECYLALSKGTVDATIFPCEAIKTWKLYEVTKYMNIGDFYVQWFWVAMNKKKYESLPENIQKAIDESSGTVAADLVGRAWNAADKAGFELGKKRGMKVIRLSADEMSKWERQCAPITKSWITRMEAKGYPARKFVERAKQLIKKYNEEFGSWQD
ncbi:MAG: TRAP transporter substrate-binding protein [Deltaproteobacteria bacterium]|nr:TRAP transporter substrate-binding protein [Deltaproteobacteria bacterium]MBW1978723.1 TRAP transporter substrate-binding protein [Deltaproteobacteria bacterium]MBW2045515.1 TRAP transporter substrate-binding protein [Deltaproteobacteria bacterium]MBW2298952.1 TRAP transporter substrate-binding protein [Deltaproteobacteria bacterium]